MRAPAVSILRTLAALACAALSAPGILAAVLPAPEVNEPRGLALLVRFDADSAEILRAEPTLDPPRADSVRPPMISEATADKFPEGTMEIVLTLLESGRQVIEEFGLSPYSNVFVEIRDESESHGGRPSPLGGPRAAWPDIRFLHIPLPEGVASVDISTRKVTVREGVMQGAASHSIDRRVLVSYQVSFSAGEGVLDQPGAPPTTGLPPLRRKPFPCHSGFGPSFEQVEATATPMPGRASGGMVPRALYGTPQRSQPSPCPIAGDGWIERIETPNPHGSSRCSFDIAILGDGFGPNDQAIFKKEAEDLAAALLDGAAPPNTGPFERLWHEINIHILYTVSTDSGISNCAAAGSMRKTFYKIQSGFDWVRDHNINLTQGYFGTLEPGIIKDALACIAPPGQIEVAIVLANCPMGYGGSAFEDLQLAVIPTGLDQVWQTNLPAHELAHAAANLGEEYVGCCKPTNPSSIHRYRNVATLQDVTNQKSSWLNLAQAGEIVSGSNPPWFVAVHRWNKPFDPKWQSMLGAFWGAQYTDIPSCGNPQAYASHCYETDACVAACDANAEMAEYSFRPMNDCRMRESTFDFCRVCETTLSEAILAPSKPIGNFQRCGQGRPLIMRGPRGLCPDNLPVLFHPDFPIGLALPSSR